MSDVLRATRSQRSSSPAPSDAKGPARSRKKGGEADASSPQISTVDFVIEEIRNGIRERRYAPGQRLIEADLMERLGVGRGSVRDALRRMTGDGIVSIEHQKGAVVRFLTRAEFISLIQVREVLEGRAARLAAGNAGKSDYRRRLVALVKDIRDRIDSGSVQVAEFMDDNDRFHNLIVEMSEDPYLAAAIKQSHGTLFRLQFHFMIDADSSIRGHAFPQADRRGDPCRRRASCRDRDAQAYQSLDCNGRARVGASIPAIDLLPTF